MMNEENTQLPISSNVSIFKVATCKKFILLLWQCKTGVCYIAAAAVELNSRFSSKVASFTHISAFIQNTLCGVFILREIRKIIFNFLFFYPSLFGVRVGGSVLCYIGSTSALNLCATPNASSAILNVFVFVFLFAFVSISICICPALHWKQFSSYSLCYAQWHLDPPLQS